MKKIYKIEYSIRSIGEITVSAKNKEEAEDKILNGGENALLGSSIKFPTIVKIREVEEIKPEKYLENCKDCGCGCGEEDCSK